MSPTSSTATTTRAETFLLGARENEEYVDGLTVYSPQAPLGTALIGAQAGRRREYEGPNGRKNKVEVISRRAVHRLSRLLEDPVAALAEPGQHLLGVRLAAGLELQVHLDLVEVQPR